MIKSILKWLKHILILSSSLHSYFYIYRTSITNTVSKLKFEFNNLESLKLSSGSSLQYCLNNFGLLLLCSVKLYIGITTSRLLALPTRVFFVSFTDTVSKRSTVFKYYFFISICCYCCCVCFLSNKYYVFSHRYMPITLIT